MKKEQILYEMIWYIQNKKEFTAQELADEFHLSVRSVYRYITDLADLGVYVESKKGRNGGFKVLSTQFLPAIMFTKDELFSLYFAIESLRGYRDFPFKLNTTSAKEKLLQVVPAATRVKLEELSNHFQIVTPKQVVSASYLNELIIAVLDRQIVKMVYHSKTQQTEKTVEPIGIYASNGYWYFTAFDRKIEETRHYRVDRIEELQRTEEAVTITRRLEKEEYKPKQADFLLVELTKKGVKECLENRYLYSAVQENEDGTGTLLMTIDRSDIPFTTEFFFLLGKEAKVKQPEKMVQLLRKKAKELLEVYVE